MNIDDFVNQPDIDKLVVIEIQVGRKLQLETWTQCGSPNTNAWYIDFSNDGEVVKVEEDGSEYTEKFSIADCHATASTFYYDDLTKILYVHTSGSDDPASETGGDPDYNIVASWWEFFSNRPKQLEPYEDILGESNGSMDFWTKFAPVESYGDLDPGADENLRSDDQRFILSQSFEHSIAMDVSTVKISIQRQGNPSGNIWCEIHSSQVGTSGTKDASTNIVGQASDNVSAGGLPTSYAWKTFTFSGTKPSLAASTTYYLMFYGDFSVGASNFVEWARDDTPGYGDGTCYRINDSMVWTNNNFDCSFQVIGDSYWELDDWTITEAGTSTVEKESTEIYGNKSAYSCEFNVDGSNSLAQIHRDDIILKPGRKARIRFWYKMSTTGKTLKITIRDSGSNVWLQDDKVSWGASNSITITNATTWTLWEAEFVVHKSYSTYRITLARNSMTSAKAYVDDLKIERYKREVDCKPYLPNGGIPVVNQSVGDYYQPDEQLQFGSTLINNIDGWFYSRRHEEGYLWHGRKIQMTVGNIDEDYENLALFFTGVTRRPIWGNVVEIGVKDERVLFQKVPLTRFDSTNYPNVEDAFSNKPVPICLGDENRDMPLPQSNTSTKKFKISETSFGGTTYALKSVDAVYKNGVLLTLTTDYTVDLTNGEITLVTSWSSGDVITANADGINLNFFGSGSEYYLPGNLLYFLYVLLNGVSKYRLNIASLMNLNENRVLSLGKWILEEVDSLDLLIQLKLSVIFQTYVGLDGMINFPYYTADVPSDAPHYYNNDYIVKPTFLEDTDQCYKEVAIRSLYRYNDAYYRYEKEATSDQTEWNHGEKTRLLFETWLTTEFQANDLRDNFLSMVKDPIEVMEVTLPSSALLLNPTDKIYISYSEKDDNGNDVAIYDDEVFRILSIEKDLNTGHSQVRAIKDVSDFFWTIT